MKMIGAIIVNIKKNLSSKETKKTIIMLSAKRCGSTAVFRMFQKHSDVGVCHINQQIENWEPRFWDLAGKALQGEKKPFIKRLKKSHPYLKIPKTFSEAEIFQLWDSILKRLGPIVFDKSPQYLGNRTALELIYKYKEIGNDVRIFAFIRDPRDAITSQYILFGGDTPKKREARWLEKYYHLEELEQRFETIPLFRYEDFSQSPSFYAPLIFKLCGLLDYPHSYNHIRPINIGRYSLSDNPKIRTWKFSEEFIAHLKKYGYSIPQKF
jgi:hypothetical protein